MVRLNWLILMVDPSDSLFVAAQFHDLVSLLLYSALGAASATFFHGEKSSLCYLRVEFEFLRSLLCFICISEALIVVFL